MARRALLLILALLHAGGPTPCASAAPEAVVGAQAPLGCWPTADACAGRTGRCATPSIRGEVEQAWTWSVPPEVGGRIAEEPRVWHDRVVVSVRSADGAALFALSLHDGRELLPPLRLATTQPLEPCLGAQGVLLRSGPGELSIVSIAEGRWVTLWTSAQEGAFEGAVWHDDLVVARTGSGLVAWRPPGRAPLWEVQGGLRGRTALQGRQAYSVTYDEAGNALLHTTDLGTGSARTSSVLGHHTARTPPAATAQTRVVALGSHVLVHHGAPVLSKSGQVSTSIARLGSDDVGLWPWLAPPAGAQGRWIGYLEDEGKPALRLVEPLPDGGLRWYTLADAKERPDFFRTSLPVTIAGTTAWIGSRAFDTLTRRVVCRLPEDGAAFRPVPARGLLLATPDVERITAWREAKAAADAPLALGAAWNEGAAQPVTVAEGRVLLRGDGLYTGAYALDAAGALTLTPAKGKPGTRAAEDVLLAQDGDGRLVRACCLAWLPRHLERLLDLGLREPTLACLKDLQKARDEDGVRALLAAARRRGVAEKDLAPLEKWLVPTSTIARKPDAAKADAARARLAAREAEVGKALSSALERHFDDPRPEVARAFLRLALERDPAHPAATQRVLAMVPEHMRGTGTFTALDWLDRNLALATIPTRRVDVLPEGSRKLTPGERELGAARHSWRPDLIAFESDQLLVMTPMDEPERLAACLGFGELVCTALEDVFRGGQHVRTSRWPIMLQLFAEEKEYRSFAVGDREPDATREWSAGHYDPQSGVSRIYLPKGHDGWEQALQTYAHELAHHWIDDRCPLFEAREGAWSVHTPLWIVEGMAELVESFVWDVPGRTWQTFNPLASDLDTVAAMPAWDGWGALYDVVSEQFQRLDRTPQHDVRLRTTLGDRVKLSNLSLFYARAGATCMYLYHAGPKERAALLEYVKDAYTGKLRAGKGHIHERFGLTPAELGLRVETWARRAVDGEITSKQVFLR